MEKGIYDPLFILTGDFTVQSGYELLDSKIKSGATLPDAYFAASDRSSYWCTQSTSGKWYQGP